MTTSRGAKASLRLSRDAKIPLARQFADAVCRAVEDGTLRFGDLLPTVEEYARELQVSAFVPRRGMGILAEMGVVEVKKHVGARVIGRPRQQRKRILSVSEDCGDLYGRGVFTFWLGQAFERAGFRYVHVSVPRTNDAEAYARLRTEIAAGVDFAVRYYSKTKNDEIVRILDEAEIPHVAVEEAYLQYGAATFKRSGQLDSGKVVELIRQAGCRRVVQVGFGESIGDRLTARLFASGIAFSRMILPIDDSRNPVVAVQRIGLEEFARKLAKGKDWLPDLFIFMDDYLAAGALLSLTRFGVEVPRDVKVLTIANRGLGPVFYRDLTRFEYDHRQDAANVARFVIARLKGRAVQPRPLCLKFIRGETL